MTLEPQHDVNERKFRLTLRAGLYILATLLLFFFALELMISSFQHLGRDTVQTIIQATTNPFTGLFIGLLITAMIQSSSTTTALVVALVASNSLSLASAIPIIMGANVGTTITSTIVSLGFIGSKKEFRRAVAAGTYHCFFNLLTVVILFPLEFYYSVLSTVSTAAAKTLFRPEVNTASESVGFWPGFSGVINFLLDVVPGVLLIAIAFALLFASILLFRRMISDLFKASSPDSFGRFFFDNGMKSFAWGLVTTAAIRSSTITTSVVVPLVAKKVTTLRKAAPFIMGANVGTTITAFIAAALNGTGFGAMSIAMAHLLFNLIGVLIFFPIPALRELPIKLATLLGRVTLRFPLACFVFILLTFFIIPVGLIYFNQSPNKVMTFTYKIDQKDAVEFYRIVARQNPKTNAGDWTRFAGQDPVTNQEPVSIATFHRKENQIQIGDEMFVLTKPGDCWTTRKVDGMYEGCVERISSLTLAGRTFESVYVIVFRKKGNQSPKTRIYLDAGQNLILKREQLTDVGDVISTEVLMKIEED